jgi:mRNA-degrading endonuclease RelE of RelBE toxin-antitoxin system
LTEVGAGGVKIGRWSKSKRFHKEYDKLAHDLRDIVDNKLQDLTKSPMPPGLRFEKLKGYVNPEIYSIHITGNYKMTMEIVSSHATLRRVATHDEIDRQP